MNPTIYKQLDSRWASKPYPTKASSFGGNGCGCCACVHVAMEQADKANWTPESLRPWMVNQGFAYVNQGTTWQGITATLKHIGHKEVVCVWSAPMSEAWKELNKGNRIGVLLVSNGRTPDGTYWTSSGHYVAFTDYKVEDGKHWFFIKDSGGRKHDGWFAYEKSIKGALPKLWIVERIGSEPQPVPPQPTPTPTREPYKGEYPNPKKYLEKGDKGTEVKKLQHYMNWFFYPFFGHNAVTEDGIFGINTQNHAKQMQSVLGFPYTECDGKVGPKTIAKMKEYGGASPSPTPVPTTIGDKVIEACKVQADWMHSAKYGDYSPVTISHSKKAGTCVTYEGCVLQRLGVKKSGGYVWHNGKGYGTGKVTGANKKMSVMYQNNKKLSKLQSVIQKGDMILLDDNKSGQSGNGGHVMFFAGKWKDGDPYVWDVAPGMSCCKNGKARKYSGDRKCLAIVRVIKIKG